MSSATVCWLVMVPLFRRIEDALPGQRALKRVLCRNGQNPRGENWPSLGRETQVVKVSGRATRVDASPGEGEARDGGGCDRTRS